MKIYIGALFAIACGSFQCAAQSVAPAFEVASVKLFTRGGQSRPPALTADSLTISGMSLREWIQMAYRLSTPQVSGPDWMSDVRLEIAAKSAGPVDEKQMYLMMQALLAERLGVRSHMERTNTPVLALTVAKGGTKFSESTTNGPPDAKGSRGALILQRVSMTDFAVMLSQSSQQPIVDATGLTGRYDMKMDMTSYAPGAETPSDPVATIVTALQEQLGLKLESRKDGLDVLVIDHAEKTPTEN